MNYKLRIKNSIQSMIHDSCIMIRSRLPITRYSLLITFLLLLVVGCGLLVTSSVVFADGEVHILPRCGKEGTSDEVRSELYDLNSFLWLLIYILKWIFSITGSLAVLMFVYGGYLWLLSAGDENRVKEGRTTMTNAVIGVAIVLGSWLGVNVIVAALTGMPSGNNGTATFTIANTSIAWNQAGIHCTSKTEAIDFGRQKKQPPVASSSGASGGSGGGAPGGGAPAAPPAGGGAPPTGGTPGGAPPGTGPAPVANHPGTCFVSVKEKYEKWNFGIFSSIFESHWENDSSKNPNPAYTCRSGVNKTWDQCVSFSSNDASVPDKIEDSSNRTIFEFGIDKTLCTTGNCPTINQGTGKFDITGRSDCLRGELRDPGGAS